MRSEEDRYRTPVEDVGRHDAPTAGSEERKKRVIERGTSSESDDASSDCGE